MNENPASKGERLRTLTKVAGRAAQACLLAAALLFVPTSRNVGAMPRQDPACFDQAQATLANCLAASAGDPALDFLCQVAYNNNAQQCLDG